MRLVKMAFNDIKSFLLQKKYIFIILIISLVVASYFFAFFTAENMHGINMVNEYFHYSTQYYIFGNNEKIKYEKINAIQEWLSEKKLDKSKIRLYSDLLLNGEENTKGHAHLHYNLFIGTNNTDSERMEFEGETMKKEDVENKSRYALIDFYSEFLDDNVFALNNEIICRDNKYQIKAIDKVEYYRTAIEDCNVHNYDIYNEESMIESIIIPYTTYVEDKYSVYAMDIIMERELTLTEEEDFLSIIKKDFDTVNIEKPRKLITNDISEIKEQIVEYALITFLSFINIIALFNYWIDKNLRKYMIYRLCGAKKSTIFGLVLIEAMIICLTTILIGVAIYYITAPLWANFYITYVLNIRELAMTQSIIIVLVIILVSINATKIIKRNEREIGK